MSKCDVSLEREKISNEERKKERSQDLEILLKIQLLLTWKTTFEVCLFSCCLVRQRTNLDRGLISTDPTVTMRPIMTYIIAGMTAGNKDH